MANTFYKGSTQILYIFVEGEKLPVACLTDLTLNESSDFLETTTQDNKGWKTGRPLNQSYNISYSGIQIESNFAAPTKVSLDMLKHFKRARILINWSIETETTFIEGGTGWVGQLSDVSAADGLLSFTGEILGYGALAIPNLKIPNSFIFQDGSNYIFQDGNNYIFQ